jgi:predicted dehydrogenase
VLSDFWTFSNPNRSKEKKKKIEKKMASSEQKQIRWAILSTGKIAQDFVKCLKVLESASIVAVASRSQDSARAFVSSQNLDSAVLTFDSVSALAACDQVDIVYIASPHSGHYLAAKELLTAKKHVLCEKPMCINDAQARQLVDVAATHNVFLMNGLWTRFFPAALKVRELIDSRAIGDVRVVAADFGFRQDFSVERLYNPEIGGGALLDIGVYVVALAFAAAGGSARPVDVHASATLLGESTVDETTAILLRFDNGVHATLSCTLAANTPRAACIIGTHGRIDIPRPFWCPTEIVHVDDSDAEHRHEFPLPEALDGDSFHFFNSAGLFYEAQHVNEMLAAGRTDSTLMPNAETLAIMSTMQEIRRQANIKYPDAIEALVD